MPAALLALVLAVVPVDTPHVEALVYVAEPSSGRAALNLWLSAAAVAPRPSIRLHAHVDPADVARYAHALRVPPEVREPDVLAQSLGELHDALSRVAPGRPRIVYAVVLAPQERHRALLSRALRRLPLDRLHLFTDDPELAVASRGKAPRGVTLLCAAGGARFAAAVAGVLSGLADSDRDGTVDGAEAGAWVARSCGRSELPPIAVKELDEPVLSSAGAAALSFGEALEGEFVVQPVLAPAPWLAFAKAAGADLSLRAPPALYQVLRRGSDGASTGAAFVLRSAEQRVVTPERFNVSAQFPADVPVASAPGPEEVAEFEKTLRDPRFAVSVGPAVLAGGRLRGGAELALAFHGAAFVLGGSVDATFDGTGQGAAGGELFAGPSLSFRRLRLSALAAAGVQQGRVDGSGIEARASFGPLLELRLSHSLGIRAIAQVGLAGARGWSVQAKAGGGVAFWW